MNVNTSPIIDRRAFLWRAGAAAGVGAVLPLLGREPAAATSTDPDSLFKAGKFREADRGYRRILRKDPGNAHASLRVGYIALLSNRFADAERFLGAAVRLAPGDKDARTYLADCFVRQNRLTRAAPLLAGTDRAPYGTLYAAATGRPYEVGGARQARLDFTTTDPLPQIEATVNGGRTRRFLLDTGAPLAGIDREVAKEAGVEVVATMRGGIPGHEWTINLGYVREFRFGGIELRNVPVTWGADDSTQHMPTPPGEPQPSGIIGTGVFHRFLTTMDYAGGALILRRKTRGELREFQRRTDAERLPLWLPVSPFIPATLGSLEGYGPHPVSLDTGGARLGVVTTEETAKKIGLEMDYDNPHLFNGVIKTYPIRPAEISLGRAVGRDVYGVAGPLSFDARYKFDTIANFTHEFFKPFAVTFDYLDMNLYITG